jgi:hypothetical protein
MNASHEMLEDQLQNYQESLGGLKSYVNELKTMTAKHGTDRQHFEGDLTEAEHNIGFYEGEITRLKELLGGSTPGASQSCVGTILPQTRKQGISSLIFSSIGFIAGAILGSRLQPRKGSESRKSSEDSH